MPYRAAEELIRQYKPWLTENIGREGPWAWSLSVSNLTYVPLQGFNVIITIKIKRDIDATLFALRFAI